MDDIMVSICCAAYNHEKYIRETLEGFVNQKTNFKFEVLVHDDASTDKTADIIREYEEKYPDIIKPIYQTENQYSKKIKITWKYLYPIAKGKYIALCEGDDYWSSETKLQEQVDIMEKNPNVTLCTHKVRCVKEDGEAMEMTYPDSDHDIKEGLIPSDDFMKMLLGNNKYLFQTSSYLIKASLMINLIEAAPDYMKLSPTGDVGVMWHCAIGGDAYFINKEMSNYRRGVSGSWSSRNKSKDFVIRHHNRLIEAYKSLDEYTNRKYHDLIKKNIRSMEVSILRLEGNAVSFKDKIGILIQKLKPVIYRILKKYLKPIFKLITRRHYK